ncbi:hypothetical protein [Mycobacterium sp. shizuoka-1]|uniref:hypothetical protein n=1 Tax=Mycobacterium sp. shizuoka-1 TaxID=2039281 RepID=UPI000C066273|nr:hypothetical protein [Mycobacterium sp. shizuoka-1]GAY14315.1 hypothetical protein MSZK_10410 [Mycobacterium sp. shizuoka-1]
MQTHGETGNGGGLHAGTDIEDSADTAVRTDVPDDRPPRGGLSIFPIVLGVFVCALSIWIAVRLGTSVISAKTSGAFGAALLATSLLIGVFLILYAVVLRRAESADVSRSTGSGDAVAKSGRALRYVKWVVVPLLLGLAGAGLTVWAAADAQPSVASPDSPKSCFQLYQDAMAMHKQNPKFRLPARDRDEVRCAINKTVLSLK